MKTLLRGLVIAALVFVPGVRIGAQGGKEVKSFDDAEFVKKAASGNHHEVELGKLAAERASNSEVKRFGERMVKDHGKALKDLETAAKAVGVTVPDKMMKKHQQEYDKFNNLKGKDFDSAYVKHMVKDHEHDVKAFTKASKQAKNAEVRRFAEQTLPVIQEHLQQIKEIQRKLDGGR